MTPSPAAAAARLIIAAHGHALRGIPLLRLTEALTAPEVLAALRVLLAEQDRASAMQARLDDIYDEAAATAVEYPCQLGSKPLSSACDLCPLTLCDPRCPHHPECVPEVCNNPCLHYVGQGLEQCEGRR